MSNENFTRVTCPQIFWKLPGEAWTHDAQRVLDLEAVLNGATLDDVESISVAVIDDSEDATNDGVATLTAGNGAVDGTTVLYDVEGGYHQADYDITIICNLDGGGRIGATQRVFVRSH